MLISFNEAIRFDAGEFARLLKSLSQQAENKWKWYNEKEVLPTIVKSNLPISGVHCISIQIGR